MAARLPARGGVLIQVGVGVGPVRRKDRHQCQQQQGLVLRGQSGQHHSHSQHHSGVDHHIVAVRLKRRSLTERLPAVVLNKAGYEVAPDLFLEEFAKREAVDQASGEDDAASLRAAVESRDLHDGFLLYGYIYDADELRALAEDTLDVEKIELVTDGERCPVYYIELK